MFEDPMIDQAFERDGYVVVDLLRDEQIAALTRVFEQHPPPANGLGFVASMLLHDRAYRRAVDREIKAILGPPLTALLHGYRLFHGSFALKRPRGHASGVGLHQDVTFVDEARYTSVNVWCPLVEVGPDNGWLYVVRGSHRFNRGFRDPSSLAYEHLVDVIMDEYLTYLPMRPGQVLLMHPCTFHGSPPNRSAHTRVVAAGVMAPRDCPLLYCHREPTAGNQEIEVFEVEEEFFLEHVVGNRPAAGRLRGVVPATPEPLEAQRLAAVCAPLVRGRPDHGHVSGFSVTQQP